MKILRLDAEAQVAELASQAFKFRANASAKTKKMATAALLKANPHLADVATLPAGTTIVVPEVPGLEAASDAKSAEGPGTDLLENLVTGIDAAREGLTVALKRNQQEMQETLRLARLPELQTLLKREHPAAAALLSEIEAQTNKQAEEEKALSERLERAFQDMRNDLKGLGQRSR